MKTNNEFDSAVLNLIKDGAPGAAIAVLRDGEFIHRKTYGLADLEWGNALVPESSFRIASLTKQFTAMAIMRLAEQGALSIDDALEAYLPDFDSRGRRVTLRHLLSHTSGIRTHDHAPGDRTDRPNTPREQILKEIITAPFDFEPGSKYQYCNSGYLLLGAVIEAVSGLDYEAFLKAAFFDPLGMTRTALCTADAIIPLRARGYTRGKGGFQNAKQDPINWSYSAGGLCSTLDDLAVWDRALRDGSVIAPDSFASMLEATPLTDGSLYPNGFGWQLATYEGHRLHHHTGGNPGFACQMARLTDPALTTIVLSNLHLFPFELVTRRLLRLAVGLAPVEAAARPTTVQEFNPCTGRYRGEHGAEIVFSAQMHMGLRTLSDGRFLNAQDPEVEYRFSEFDGENYQVYELLTPLGPVHRHVRCQP